MSHDVAEALETRRVDAVDVAVRFTDPDALELIDVVFTDEEMWVTDLVSGQSAAVPFAMAMTFENDEAEH